MDDLVKRLRIPSPPLTWDQQRMLRLEAAAEIERLTAELRIATSDLTIARGWAAKARFERDDLRKEVEALRADAERWAAYRKATKVLAGTVKARPISTNPYDGM